tara:strand:- start:203 stop:526 length:324 start_codon:yes stop_codon:yes gene_type:complete
LEIIKCDNYKGWFVGDFQPNLLESKDLEFGYKRIIKGTKPDYHYHKFKTEFTILLEGSILLEKTKKIIEPISCIKLNPFETNDQYFIEDCLILIINSPSVKNDKHLL